MAVIAGGINEMGGSGAHCCTNTISNAGTWVTCTLYICDVYCALWWASMSRVHEPQIQQPATSKPKRVGNAQATECNSTSLNEEPSASACRHPM
jgi:hypothetical protein